MRPESRSSQAATKHVESSLDCTCACFCLSNIWLILLSMSGNLNFIFRPRGTLFLTKHSSATVHSEVIAGTAATKQREPCWGGRGGCICFSKFLRILPPAISNPGFIMWTRGILVRSEQGSAAVHSEVDAGPAATKQGQPCRGSCGGCFCSSKFLRILPPSISNLCVIMWERDAEHVSWRGRTATKHVK